MGQTAYKENKPIEYNTKYLKKVQYHAQDLRGAHKFKKQPSDAEIQKHFQRCLEQASLNLKTLNQIKTLPLWMKHRIAEKHDEKLGKVNIQNKISSQIPSHVIQTYLKMMIKHIQSSKQITIKPSLIQLQSYIQKNNCSKIFIKLQGIYKLLKVLKRQNIKCQQGLSNRLQSQIQIIKFLKHFYLKNSDLYISDVSKIPNYLHYLLFNINSSQTALTLCSIDMITLYTQSLQDTSETIDQLLSFSVLNSHKSFILEPFVQILKQTNNVILIFCVMKFINRLILHLKSHEKSVELKTGLKKVGYEKVISSIKNKIKQKYYSVEYCTYEYVHNKNRQRKSSYTSNQKQEDNDSDLEFGNEEENQLQNKNWKNDESTIYLAENDEEKFQNYKANILKEKKSYSDLDKIIAELQIGEAMTQKILTYNFDVIRQKSKKIGSMNIFSRIVDNLKEFDKNDWKLLDSKIREIRGIYEMEEQNEQIIKIKEQLKTKQLFIQQKQNEIVQLTRRISEMSQQKQRQLEQKQRQKQRQRQTQIQQNHKKNLDEQNQINCLNFSTQFFIQSPSQFRFENNQNEQQILSSNEKQQNTKNNIQYPLNQSLLPALPPPPSLITQNNNLSITQLLPPPPPNIDSLNISAFIPLPPPIFAPPAISSSKQKSNPSIPTKSCPLDVILSQEQINNTVWKECNDLKIKIQSNRIQALFAKPQTLSSTMTQIPVISMAQIVKKQNITPYFLIHQRNKNIQIILNKALLGKTNKQLNHIFDLILKAQIPELLLESLQKILPTQEQKNLAKQYRYKDDLNLSQQFICGIINIPCYQERMTSILFKQQYSRKIQDLQMKQDQLENAFKKIKSSKELLHVLQVSLALSNYLNGQNNKGGAWGFKLSSLQKLNDVKSENQDWTLAFQMIKIVKQTFCPILQIGFIQKIKIITQSTISQCKEQLSTLQTNLIKAQMALKSYVPSNPFDKINKCCQQMIRQLQYALPNLKFKQQCLDNLFEDCCKFYCLKYSLFQSQNAGKVFLNAFEFIQQMQSKYVKVREKQQKEIKNKPVTKTQTSSAFKKQSHPQVLRSISQQYNYMPVNQLTTTCILQNNPQQQQTNNPQSNNIITQRPNFISNLLKQKKLRKQQPKNQ